jgi:hypothetical protein
MAVADFNEFTWQRVHVTQFEFAHGRELVEIGRDTNQSEEARTGADVIHLLRTRGGFRFHVIQYKRSHFPLRRGAKIAATPANTWPQPLWFEIDTTDGHRQHNRLCDLVGIGAVAYYVAPRFTSRHELRAVMTAWEWIAPAMWPVAIRRAPYPADAAAVNADPTIVGHFTGGIHRFYYDRDDRSLWGWASEFAYGEGPSRPPEGRVFPDIESLAAALREAGIDADLLEGYSAPQDRESDPPDREYPSESQVGRLLNSVGRAVQGEERTASVYLEFY